MHIRQVLQLYRTMQLIRTFEEAAGKAFHDGRIRGPVHQYVGQEAIAVGVCANLRATTTSRATTAATATPSPRAPASQR